MKERTRSTVRIVVAALLASVAIGSTMSLHATTAHAATSSCDGYVAASYLSTLAGLQLAQQAQSACSANPSSPSCQDAVSSQTSTWDWVAWNNGMNLCCNGEADASTCSSLASNPVSDPNNTVATSQPGPSFPN